MTPDKHTNQELFLDVGDGHQVYVQDWGTAKATIPIFYLHGGPGNGCDDRDKKKFDPATQRVIFHDQRGAGKSLPKASLEHNTAADLVADITKIADKLDIKKFLLVGGSWGSTLALLYGIDSPGRVAGIVIDGVFTASQIEIDWLDKGGWRVFYPDIWKEYVDGVPASHKGRPSTYYFDKALNGSGEEAKKASYAYLKMELALLRLDDRYEAEPYEAFDPAGGIIEIHYLHNRCFLTEDYIFKNAGKITAPVRMVQGQYDMVCPPQTAYELDKLLSDSKLIMTINGHLRQHEASTVQKLLIKQLLGEG
jgi:proline iminopeptidase